MASTAVWGAQSSKLTDDSIIHDEIAVSGRLSGLSRLKSGVRTKTVASVHMLGTHLGSSPDNQSESRPLVPMSTP